nr:hypothetical protein BaRGS_003731 [Batillaria attramentaria]
MMMVTDEDGKGDNVDEDDTDDGVDDEANGNEGGDGKMSSYGERRLEEGDDNSGDFDEEDDVYTPPHPALSTTITASTGRWRKLRQPSSAEEGR